MRNQPNSSVTAAGTAGDSGLALSVAEVAKEIGVSRQLVYEAINSGELPARKFAGRTLIIRSDLIAFLNALPLAAKRSA